MYRQTLKGKTQAFILLALLWTPFCGLGISDWLEFHRCLDFSPNTLPDLVVWGLQLIFISLAVHFARFERPAPTLCVKDDLWLHLAVHACWWILFANLPLLALWQGSLIPEILVHGLLILGSVGGFLLLRRKRGNLVGP